MYVGCRKQSYLYSAVSDGNAQALPMRFKSKIDIQTMKHIRDIVQEYSIDIINAQSSEDRYLSIFAKKFYKLDTLVVHTRRQMPLMDAGKIQGWFYNTFTDKIIAVSAAVKNGLMAGGIKDTNIKVIYNGTPREKYESINTDRVGSLLEQYKIRDDEFVIGCVSRRKKQDQLFKALSLIEKPVKVIFVGIQRDDFSEDLIQSVPSRHSLIFCGSVPFDEVLEYYKLFDVSVLPSTTEGLSQALLEAMALGVPVVATDSGGNSELIQDGENGFLFQDENLEEFAEKIRIVLEDVQLKKKIVQKGETTALEKFSVENTVLNHEKFFLSLLNNE